MLEQATGMRSLQPIEYASPRTDIDALNMAYNAASRVQERATRLKKELGRARLANSNRKDSMDQEVSPILPQNVTDKYAGGHRGLSINQNEYYS